MYDEFFPQLVSLLPIKDPEFVKHLTRLFPDNVIKRVQAKPTRAEAAVYFLDSIIKPTIRSGDNETFKMLCLELEKCKNVHLKYLAQNMGKKIKKIAGK